MVNRAQKSAQASGAAAEATVEAINAYYHRCGSAWVVKRPTPVRVIGGGRGGHFKGVWSSPAGVDFTGIMRGGRGVAFDCKASGSASIPLEPRAGVPCLRPSQVAELTAVANLGGLAGVLALVRPRDRGRPIPTWFWISWSGWQLATGAAATAGRKSIGLDLLRAHGLECSRHYDRPLWMEAAMALEASA